jgi:ABC-type glycerol-3-phosphate transport system permease component
VTLPMMRNIIAITALFSLIVTFANFDIVRVLTKGDPLTSHPLFATWRSVSASKRRHSPGGHVSLFMVPILAVAATSSCATSPSAGVKSDGRRRNRSRGARGRAELRSMSRRPALGAALVVFLPVAVRHLLPDAADLHVHHLAEDQRGDLGGQQSLVGLCPTLSNYVELLTQNDYLTFFRNSAIVSVCVVAITMLISVIAAFALARMKFWGSATLATGVFLTPT